MKETDEDAKLIANRINLLRQEQTRSIKKIEETKRKAY